MAVIINKKGLSAVIHLTSNAVVNVTGNSTTSDIAVGNEEILGAVITQVWYGSEGHWVIKRGSNTVAVFDSTGYTDFAGCGITLNVDATASTLSANLVNTGNGFVIVELTKVPTTSVYS